jgi:hypothetical protein
MVILRLFGEFVGSAAAVRALAASIAVAPTAANRRGSLMGKPLPWFHARIASSRERECRTRSQRSSAEWRAPRALR